jgi:quinol monooxygenase YgiN
MSSIEGVWENPAEAAISIQAIRFILLNTKIRPYRNADNCGMCAILIVMEIGRRELVSGTVILILGRAAAAQPEEAHRMYGLIGSMTAAPGRRDDLIAILTEAVSNMPGCLSYIVAKDVKDENTIWITEVWDSQESHDASLSLPSVRKAISAARPMIAAFGNQVITTPVGGYGLPAAKPR